MTRLGPGTQPRPERISKLTARTGSPPNCLRPYCATDVNARAVLTIVDTSTAASSAAWTPWPGLDSGPENAASLIADAGQGQPVRGRRRAGRGPRRALEQGLEIGQRPPAAATSSIVPTRPGSCGAGRRRPRSRTRAEPRSSASQRAPNTSRRKRTWSVSVGVKAVKSWRADQRGGAGVRAPRGPVARIRCRARPRSRTLRARRGAPGSSRHGWWHHGGRRTRGRGAAVDHGHVLGQQRR